LSQYFITKKKYPLLHFFATTDIAEGTPLEYQYSPETTVGNLQRLDKKWKGLPKRTLV